MGIVNTRSTASRTAGQCIRRGGLGKMGQRVDGRCVLSGCASGKAIFHLPCSSYQTNLGRRWSESPRKSLRAGCQEEAGAALTTCPRRWPPSWNLRSRCRAQSSSLSERHPTNETSLAGAQVRLLRLSTKRTSSGRCLSIFIYLTYLHLRANANFAASDGRKSHRVCTPTLPPTH